MKSSMQIFMRLLLIAVCCVVVAGVFASCAVDPVSGPDYENAATAAEPVASPQSSTEPLEVATAAEPTVDSASYELLQEE